MENHRIIFILFHSVLLFQLIVLGSPLKVSRQLTDFKDSASAYNFSILESASPTTTPKLSTDSQASPESVVPGVTDVEVNARFADLVKPWGFSVVWWLVFALVGLVGILVAVICCKRLAHRHNFRPQDAWTRAFRPIQRRFHLPVIHHIPFIRNLPFIRRLSNINEDTLSLVELVNREVLEDQMGAHNGLIVLNEENYMGEVERDGQEQDNKEDQMERQGSQHKKSEDVGELDNVAFGIDNVAFDHDESDTKMMEEENTWV